MAEYYILEGREVKPAPLDLWAASCSGTSRVVARSDMGCWGELSTVFLGIDHSFFTRGIGPPLLFETMVFGGPFSDEQWRWTTYDEAEAAHAQIVERLAALFEGVPEDRRVKAAESAYALGGMVALVGDLYAR